MVDNRRVHLETASAPIPRAASIPSPRSCSSARSRHPAAASGLAEPLSAKQQPPLTERRRQSRPCRLSRWRTPRLRETRLDIVPSDASPRPLRSSAQPPWRRGHDCRFAGTDPHRAMASLSRAAQEWTERRRPAPSRRASPARHQSVTHDNDPRCASQLFRPQAHVAQRRAVDDAAFELLLASACAAIGTTMLSQSRENRSVVVDAPPGNLRARRPRPTVRGSAAGSDDRRPNRRS